MQPFVEVLSRIAFGVGALVLVAMSIALVVYGGAEAIHAFRADDPGVLLLVAIGYIVIAMAVFDVAKYFIEEEVIRGREMRSAAEARHSLTKFISVIAIAVFIEGLVLVFRASKTSMSEMMYPTALLLTAVIIVVGLGVFQRLSVEVERKAGPEDDDDD